MGFDMKQTFNGLALQNLTKRIDIPDAELGIDSGEDLRNQTLKVQYQDKRSFVVIPVPGTMAMEYTQLDGQAQQVNVEDLPKDFYFGSPRGDF